MISGIALNIRNRFFQNGKPEPISNNSFVIQIEGVGSGVVTIPEMQYVSGIGQSIKMNEIRPGGYKGVYKFGGRVQNDQVTLRRLLGNENILENWWLLKRDYDRGAPGYIKDVVITVTSRMSPGINRSWMLCRCYPISWRSSALESLGNSAAFEELIIGHNGIKKT